MTEQDTYRLAEDMAVGDDGSALFARSPSPHRFHEIIILVGAGSHLARHDELLLSDSDGIAGQGNTSAEHDTTVALFPFDGHDIPFTYRLPTYPSIVEDAVFPACAQAVAPSVHHHAVASYQ